MRLRLFFVMVVMVVLSLLSACHGHKNSNAAAQPANVGGGYTLEASGGTLNDGSGVNGLAVLVTLRDSAGNGPSQPWTVSITGPDFAAPLTVSYDDASPSSYMSWWWAGFEPLSGAYTATATDGKTTLTFAFTINATQNVSQPVLNKSTNTVSWSPVFGAGGYYYRVTDGTGADVMQPGYIAADPQQSSYSIGLPALTDGSYLVEVIAQATNRLDLQNDISASPALASQENMSMASIDFVIGGGYALDARGGVLYEGVSSWGTGTADQFGISIWASILTAPTDSASSPMPPAGDWTISVTGPSISTPIAYTYPRTASHYLYWDFGTVPAGGVYTVTATPVGGGASITQTFSIPDPTAKLPVATGLAAVPTTGGGATINWDTVVGANSYYVNVWAVTGGVYTEIAGTWVTSTSAIVPNSTLTPGVDYDVYITASELDMTDIYSVPVPVSPGPQVNMSDTTFTYVTITAQ